MLKIDWLFFSSLFGISGFWLVEADKITFPNGSKSKTLYSSIKASILELVKNDVVAYLEKISSNHEMIKTKTSTKPVIRILVIVFCAAIIGAAIGIPLGFWRADRDEKERQIDSKKLKIVSLSTSCHVNAKQYLEEYEEYLPAFGYFEKFKVAIEMKRAELEAKHNHTTLESLLKQYRMKSCLESIPSEEKCRNELDNETKILHTQVSDPLALLSLTSAPSREKHVDQTTKEHLQLNQSRILRHTFNFEFIDKNILKPIEKLGFSEQMSLIDEQIKQLSNDKLLFKEHQTMLIQKHSAILKWNTVYYALLKTVTEIKDS